VTSRRLATPIFISYRRDDDGGEKVCAPLYRELAAVYGEDQVFWDRVSLENGPFAPHLEAQVLAAKTVFVMIGSVKLWLGTGSEGNRIQRDDCWVRREVRIALTHGALVIPVVSGQERPTAADLPSDIQDLLGCTFEKLPPDPGWDTEGIAGLIAKLKRQTSLDPSIPAVLRRLIKPVQTYPLDVQAAFSIEKEEPQLWAYFQAAQGIIADPEERTEVTVRNPSLESILETLAMTVNAEGLLRFLALMVYRKENNAPVFPGLPPALREEWRNVLNEALGGRNPTWILDRERADALLRWAQEGELCPRFHLCFDREQADDRADLQIRITGWTCLGQDQRKLESDDWGVPWDERFTVSRGGGAAGISAALSPAFQEIAKRVERWLGRAATLGLPEAHRPVIEIYLRADQIAWPVEQVPLRTGGTTGHVFRMSRRLHLRHAADIPPSGWIQRSGRFAQPLRPQDITVAPDWTSLREAAEVKATPLAFATTAPADETAHDLIMDLHLICGLWIQSDSTRVPVEELVAILKDERCPKEAIRQSRETSTWRDVTILHDIHPGLRPPGLPDSKRAYRRTAND